MVKWQALCHQTPEHSSTDSEVQPSWSISANDEAFQKLLEQKTKLPATFQKKNFRQPRQTTYAEVTVLCNNHNNQVLLNCPFHLTILPHIY